MPPVSEKCSLLCKMQPDAREICSETKLGIENHKITSKNQVIINFPTNISHINVVII